MPGLKKCPFHYILVKRKAEDDGAEVSGMKDYRGFTAGMYSQERTRTTDNIELEFDHTVGDNDTNILTDLEFFTWYINGIFTG